MDAPRCDGPRPPALLDASTPTPAELLLVGHSPKWRRIGKRLLYRQIFDMLAVDTRDTRVHTPAVVLVRSSSSPAGAPERHAAGAAFVWREAWQGVEEAVPSFVGCFGGGQNLVRTGFNG